MTTVYLDFGVLIAAAQASQALHSAASQVLLTDQFIFATSDMVWLETTPLAHLHGRRTQITYERFFREIATVYVTLDRELVASAKRLALRWAVGGADALHVAAALRAGATCLITTEGRGKAIARVGALAVQLLRA